MPGDTVYLCFGGKSSPGLYAKATVQTRPAAIVPEPWQQRYAVNPLPADERAEKPLRVRLKIDQHLEVPVARSDIYGLPELSRHQFVTARIGTNFRLTPGQADAIERLMAVPRVTGNPGPARPQRGKRSQPIPLQNIHEAHLEEVIASDLEKIEPGLT